MVNIIGMMVGYFKGCGKMAKEMVKVVSYILMDMSKQEYGKMIREQMQNRNKKQLQSRKNILKAQKMPEKQLKNNNLTKVKNTKALVV